MHVFIAIFKRTTDGAYIEKIKPIHNLKSYIFNIFVNIIIFHYLSHSLSRGHFLSSFTTKILYVFIIFLMRATFPVYTPLLVFSLE
jgi:hypothetical protein